MQKNKIHMVRQQTSVKYFYFLFFLKNKYIEYTMLTQTYCKLYFQIVPETILNKCN